MLTDNARVYVFNRDSIPYSTTNEVVASKSNVALPLHHKSDIINNMNSCNWALK